jgi:NAD(P)-dependent dehydrogenase (short-subunit alcohol dehydrogenase family)
MAIEPAGPEPLFLMQRRSVLVTGASSGLGAHFSALPASIGPHQVPAARWMERLDVRLDVVVNNADIGADAPALTTPLIEFDRVMDTPPPGL